ncbi:hypothetical protein [Sorangium sp. So ce513]|uniref:hypothetical protein n=1 Tax=Sorangium sp. So ce513 TaxID=3133315 RepID=UPI003F62D427
MKRAARYLQELGPGGEGEEALRPTAAAAWDMAARYDVRNEHGMMRQVGLCHISGAELDADPRRPWVREVLNNLAACHACLFAPETSCQHFNLRLDRAMLRSTPEAPNVGCFRDILAELT